MALLTVRYQDSNKATRLGTWEVLQGKLIVYHARQWIPLQLEHTALSANCQCSSRQLASQDREKHTLILSRLDYARSPRFQSFQIKGHSKDSMAHNRHGWTQAAEVGRDTVPIVYLEAETVAYLILEHTTVH